MKFDDFKDITSGDKKKEQKATAKDTLEARKKQKQMVQERDTQMHDMAIDAFKSQFGDKYEKEMLIGLEHLRTDFANRDMTVTPSGIKAFTFGVETMVTAIAEVIANSDETEKEKIIETLKNRCSMVSMAGYNMYDTAKRQQEKRAEIMGAKK